MSTPERVDRGFMSFQSKKAGNLRLRNRESQVDALFEGSWDELVIRFDPESRSYRVMTASEPEDKETRLDLAKAAAADV